MVESKIALVLAMVESFKTSSSLLAGASGFISDWPSSSTSMSWRATCIFPRLSSSTLSASFSFAGYQGRIARGRCFEMKAHTDWQEHNARPCFPKPRPPHPFSFVPPALFSVPPLLFAEPPRLLLSLPGPCSLVPFQAVQSLPRTRSPWTRCHCPCSGVERPPILSGEGATYFAENDHSVLCLWLEYCSGIMSFKARDEADVRLHECPAIDLRGHGHVGPNILVLQMKCLKECPHVRENRRHLRHLLFGEANSVEDLVLGYGSAVS